MTTFVPATHRGVFAVSNNVADAEQLWMTDLFCSVEKSKNTHDYVISNTAPVDTTVLWLDPDNANAAPGIIYIWDGTIWVPITPDLYAEYMWNKGNPGTAGGGGPATAIAGNIENGALVTAGSYIFMMKENSLLRINLPTRTLNAVPSASSAYGMISIGLDGSIRTQVIEANNYTMSIGLQPAGTVNFGTSTWLFANSATASFSPDHVSLMKIS